MFEQIGGTSGMESGRQIGQVTSRYQVTSKDRVARKLLLWKSKSESSTL